ncbi:MAG: AbrB/MazE/SpoVT family DNA-binding domain-containing protein [Thermincolia bacterium]
MEVRKIFKAGNSCVVSLPNDILNSLGVKDGSQITIDFDKENKRIIISPLTVPKQPVLTQEYAEMVEEFITEYEVALKELAK